MSRRRFVAGSALVAGAVALVAILRWLAAPRIEAGERTVAVLAFDVVVPSDGADTVADAKWAAGALRDSLVSKLAGLPGVRLVGGSRMLDSTMRVLRPREIGATLGARVVVTGERAGEDRLSVRLLEVEMGEQLFEITVSLHDGPAALGAVATRLARDMGVALRIPADSLPPSR